MKRITDEQILGEMGVNLVQSLVLEMKFTWHPTNQPVEAGLDGWVELRDSATGEVANCWIGVQSKARSELPEDDKSVKYSCKQKDLDYWLEGSMPVILVVSKPKEKLAWWVSVKDYFRGRDPKTERTIVFDKRLDLLTSSSGNEWQAIGTRYGSGTYLSPPQVTETLTSNLLKVSRFAETIFSAQTECEDLSDFHEQLREKDDYPPREWVMDGNTVHSFHDLHSEPWRDLVLTETISSKETTEFAYSEVAELRRIFVRLLGQCFRQIASSFRLWFSKEQECYFFAPNRSEFQDRDVVREQFYQSRKQKTSRDVVRKIVNKNDKTKIAYYRHDAFEHRFLRFGRQWYMMLEPTYVFTTDGYEPDPFREEHLSAIKTFEGDAAIAGKIFMYSNIFRDRDSLLEDNYPFLGFDGIENTEIPVGIDDAAWANIKAKANEAEKEPEEKPFAAGLFD